MVNQLVAKDDNKPNTDKVPESLKSKAEKLDNDIGRAMYNVEASDKKDIPKQKDETVDKLAKQIDKIRYPTSRTDDDNLVDILNRLNLTVGKNTKDVMSTFSQLNKGANGSKKEKLKAGREDLFKQLQDGFANVNKGDENSRITRYDDYDVLDAAIPELNMALNVYRDSILSPDDVTKKSLMYKYDDKKPTKDETGVASQFDTNMKTLIKKFDIDNNVSTNTRDALKYGDLFLLILDMKREANRMLNEGVTDSSTVLTEQNISDPESNILLEKLAKDVITDDMFDKYAKNYKDTTQKYVNTKSKLDKDKFKDTIIQNTKQDVADRINQNVQYYDNPADMISDIQKTNQGLSGKDRVNYGFEGAFVKNLNPRDVIKLDLDGITFGYLYFDTSAKNIDDPDDNLQYGGSGNTASMLNMMASQMSTGSDQVTINQQSSTSSTETSEDSINTLTGTVYKNTALRYKIISDLFINGIGKKIDKKFIRKNKELQQTIFDLVQHDYILNKKVKVTFLTADQIYHLKLDSTDTYGVSILNAAIFPAKLYLSTLLTNIIVKVTRGRDRRIYYIDTGLDADLEGTVQGMIRDMKQDEFSVGSFGADKSMNSMFKQVGIGSDMYVPVVDGKLKVSFIY